MWIRRILKHLCTIFATALLGGLLGATLVRLAPGFGVHEEELDSRLSQESISSLRRESKKESNLLQFYVHYLSGLVTGNLGVSRSLGRPVTELLADRIPVTLRSIGIGLVAGWLLGLLLALPTAMFQSVVYELFSGFVSGLFLCLPAAALALLFLFVDGPTPLAIGLVVFPRVYRYVRNVMVDTRTLPHIVAAKAKGLGENRILWWHIVLCSLPQILALAGVSVSMALGAAIPIEVVCDSPGIGQLAWQAALGRDLPLLVNLTLLVTLVTLIANFGSDLVSTTCGAAQT